MFFTAFAMPLCDRELAVGYSHLFGPIAGVRASLLPSPAVTDVHSRPTRAHTDGAIDFDADRAGVASARTDRIVRLAWNSLSRLFAVGAATLPFRESVHDACSGQRSRTAPSASYEPDASFEPFEM